LVLHICCDIFVQEFFQMKPFDIVREFESALCEYTGAPYAVTTNSCTAALFLATKYALRYSKTREVCIPRFTYVSVPMVIIQAGARVGFDDRDWRGSYSLNALRVRDSARRFTSGMYRGGFDCVSFHRAKILAVSQGGAILHDDPAADVWFRKARFDGRTEGVAPIDDEPTMIGYHCYMSPDTAAAGLWALSYLPLHNDDLPNDDYRDLSLTDWESLR
jgi:dTDP-4-amino-4,6-dideoxygalactose transaminase